MGRRLVQRREAIVHASGTPTIRMTTVVGDAGAYAERTTVAASASAMAVESRTT